jgi:hypothetical protein
MLRNNIYTIIKKAMENLRRAFGVSCKSIQGRALYFETYLPEYGALYDKLPISAFVEEPH